MGHSVHVNNKRRLFGIPPGVVHDVMIMVDVCVVLYTFTIGYGSSNRES